MIAALRGLALAAAGVAMAVVLAGGSGLQPPVGTEPAPPEALAELRLGLIANTAYFGPEAGVEQDRVLKTGIRWLREEFSWSAIEPAAGKWDWSDYDPVVAAAAKRHMHILALLNDTPSWVGPTSETLPTEAQFAAYARAVVGRYGRGGTFWRDHPKLPADGVIEWWELWNEPYWWDFADPVDPARYARLVRAGATAGREADPQARFLIGADITGVEEDGDSVEWIDNMYRAVPDLGRYYDAVAVHPYGDLDKYTPGRRWQFRRVEDMRRTFNGHGDDKPVWITEIGWATNPDGGWTETQQADLYTRLLNAVGTTYRGWIQAVFAYHFRDHRPQDPSNKENWFGILRADGSHKPAYDVLSRAAADAASATASEASRGFVAPGGGGS